MTRWMMTASAVALSLAISAGRGAPELRGPDGPAPEATTRSAPSVKWSLALSLPATSQEALSSRSGLPWDELRRRGLILRAEGSGPVSVAVHVLRVQSGRIVKRWSSPTFQLSRSGTSTISSHYLPGSDVAGETVYPHELVRSSSPVGADQILRDIEAGRISFVKLGDGPSLVIALIPAGSDGAAGTGTNPLFLKTDPMGDH